MDTTRKRGGQTRRSAAYHRKHKGYNAAESGMNAIDIFDCFCAKFLYFLRHDNIKSWSDLRFVIVNAVDDLTDRIHKNTVRAAKVAAKKAATKASPKAVAKASAKASPKAAAKAAATGSAKRAKVNTNAVSDAVIDAIMDGSYQPQRRASTADSATVDRNVENEYRDTPGWGFRL